MTDHDVPNSQPDTRRRPAAQDPRTPESETENRLVRPPVDTGADQDNGETFPSRPAESDDPDDPDDLAPGRWVVDPTAPPVEPNEPA